MPTYTGFVTMADHGLSQSGNMRVLAHIQSEETGELSPRLIVMGPSQRRDGVPNYRDLRIGAYVTVTTDPPTSNGAEFVRTVIVHPARSTE